MNVDWTHGAAHMWDRHQVSVQEANEALADPLAWVLDPDPKSKSGDSIRVIGLCRSREELLTVILVRDPAVSWLWGANGWPSNSSDRREYMRRRRA
ncbi:hypothetical protein [Jiangella endophytica]|uniref:hypothetical protein n=1 Tax=Jiangella endophytica TaxID=1623398 RepID=UPI0018E51888|nr:hypothetical protein [Jiangella endophytica]